MHLNLEPFNLDKKKKIPCKFINTPPPSSNKCPFGDQCHFSHLDGDGNEIAVRSVPRRRRRNHYCSHAEQVVNELMLRLAMEDGLDSFFLREDEDEYFDSPFVEHVEHMLQLEDMYLYNDDSEEYWTSDEESESDDSW